MTLPAEGATSQAIPLIPVQVIPLNSEGARAECTTHEGTPLTFEGVRATGEVHGRMLEMRLEQSFRNPESHNVEVTYTFPLPWGAVLMGIEVTLNGKKLHGLVTAKQEAREQYERALSEGNSSILLSRNFDGSYTLELGNLLEKELCVVVLRYAQLLQPEQGSLRLMVPTTIAPRYGDAVRDGGFEPHASPASSAFVEYPFDIHLTFFGALAQAGVSSPSHTLVSRHSEGVLSVRLAMQGWLDRDFVVVLEELPQASVGLSALDQVEPDTATVLASFSPVLRASSVRKVALKVLVDCSGSMCGDSIEAARRALAHIVAGMGEEDRFSLSKFGSTVEHRCKGMWVGAGPAMASAMRWVEKLTADMGGTEMEHALNSTLSLPHPSTCDLLLVTDGEIHGIEDVLATALTAAHRIFVVGIGASSAETHLRRLASATGGACEFVAPGEAVEPAVLRMFHRLRSPGVTDVRIEWPPGCTLLSASHVPSAAFDGDTMTVFGRLQFDQHHVPTDPVRMLGKYGEEHADIVLAEVSLESLEDPSNTLARLWASSFCEELGEAEDAAGQAGELAERYQLVTEHTNFVLVHERAADERPTEMPELRQVKSMLAAGWGGHGSVRPGRVVSGGMDVQYSLAPPMMASRSVSSVWRTAGSSQTSPVDASAFMDDFEIPAFLRKQGDDHTPFEPPPEVDRSNQDWWADSPFHDAEFVGYSVGDNSTNGWNDDYVGLTPAGLREFLSITAREDWPKSYESLVAAGLGFQVAEWLEFVVGRELGEAFVVRTFLDVVFELTFSTEPTLLVTTSNVRVVPEKPEVGGASSLTQVLMLSLARAQPRMWPDSVVNFAEAGSPG